MAECPPETSDREIFADISGKERQGKKGKGVKIEKYKKRKSFESIHPGQSPAKI